MMSNASACEPSDGAGDLAACERACELNHSNSCANWGSLVAADDEDKARELYARACKGGSGIGCEARARVSPDGEANEYYLSARRYHRVHCAQDYARSCSQLARLYEAGLGGDADPDLASSFRQRSCVLGTASDCRH